MGLIITDATCSVKIAPMVVAKMVLLLHMVPTEKVVVYRHNTNVVRITYFLLMVPISTAVDVNTRDSDVAPIIVPLLVDRTTRVADANTRLMVAVQIVLRRPQDRITMVVRVIRISLVVVLMVSPLRKDHMDKVIV